MDFKQTLCTASLAYFAMASTAYASADRSHVIITNNTPTSIQISGRFNSTDSEFKHGEAWEMADLTLAPYQSKEVLWFSRYSHVKSKQRYQYTLSLTPTNQMQGISFTINEQGDFLRGSTVTQTLTTPDQQQAILKQKG